MQTTLNALRRANRAARIRSGKRPEVFVDPRETVAADMTTTALHPTKGFRRVSGKRAAARAKMHMMLGIAA